MTNRKDQCVVEGIPIYKYSEQSRKKFMFKSVLYTHDPCRNLLYVRELGEWSVYVEVAFYFVKDKRSENIAISGVDKHCLYKFKDVAIKKAKDVVDS